MKKHLRTFYVVLLTQKVYATIRLSIITQLVLLQVLRQPLTLQTQATQLLFSALQLPMATSPLTNHLFKQD